MAVAEELSSGGGIDPVVMTLPEYLNGSIRRPLLLFLGAVSLLLLVACANVTGLLLARQASRSREFGVRKALGAPRYRLMLQAVGESTWVALGGGVIGLALAAWSLSVLRWLEPSEFPRVATVGIDRPVLLFAFGVSTFAALSAGLTGAVPLMCGGTGTDGATLPRSDNRQGRRLRSIMVTAQLAISLVLLVGAILLARSFVRLVDVDLGVLTDRVLSVQLNLTMGRDLSESQRVALTERVLERVTTVPTVLAVGAANGLPPNQTRMAFQFEDEAATFGPPVVHRLTLLNPTPGYFAALNIRLLRGRLFSRSDTSESERVVILAASTARRLFGTLDVVGRPLPTRVERKPTIVGVVDDVKYGGLDAPPPETIYQPFSQFPFRHMNLVVRTSRDPLELTEALRHAVHEVDREIMIASANSLDNLVSESRATPRLRTALLIALAVLALGLASIGLAGVVAYSVAQRTGEIAIRIALGAEAASVLALVMREGIVLAMVGGALGLLGAYALTQTLTTFLYDVAPTDGVSFLLAALCLLLVAMGASYVPARRATSVDPMVALRAE